MQTIMNCFPVPPPPFNEILDPPVRQTEVNCALKLHYTASSNAY